MILIALCLGLLAPQDLKPPLEDPKEILKGVKAPPGWTVSLFAAPPNIGYPTCLTAAPSGELFVGIDENGSIDAKPGRGRILRCVDSDGDGRMDRYTIFADGVDSPRGLVWDGRTLYCLHPPFLRAFHDEDGDGVSERSEVLVQGIGFDLKFRGADHTTNGIQKGIDGWIYVAVGDYGFVKAVGRDGKSAQLYGGGIARVRPDGTELEVVADGLRNIYDVAVSPRLDLFTRDNTNDGGGWNVRLSHILPSAHYGYPTLFKNFPEDTLPALMDYGGGSPCGSLWVSEPGLPPGFGDALYTCDWGRSVVYRHVLPAEGASFKPEQSSFVEISRPTDMDVDGEGRLYIASWRNGGFTFSGPNVGFVVRVTPPGTREAWKDLKKASGEELVAAIGSASHVRRIHAQAELLRRPDRATLAPGLGKLLTSTDPGVRTAAVFTLKQLQGAAALTSLLTVDEASVRALADRKGETRDLPLKPFLEALSSPDPRLRLQASIALGRLGRLEAADALIPLTSDPDRSVAHAAVAALVALKAHQAALRRLDAGSFKVLQALHDPVVVDALLEQLTKPQDSERRKGLLRTLCRLHYKEHAWDGRWWGTRPDTTGPYFKPVPWEASTKIAAALKQALAGAGGAELRFLLLELQRHRLAFDEALPLVLRLASEDPSFRGSAADFLAQRPQLPPEGIALLESVASDEAGEPAVRLRAFGALNKAAALDALVRILGGLRKPPGELVQAREEFVRDGRHARNLAYFQKLAGAEAPAARELGLGVLASLSQHKNSPKALQESALRQVEAALTGPHPEHALRGIAYARADAFVHPVRSLMNDARKEVQEAALAAAKALKLDSGGGNRVILKGKTPEQIKALLAAEKGDPKKGAEFFVKQGCVACHTLSAQEAPKGPFLGDVAVKYGRAELLESVLLPNAKIAQGFATHWFETTEEDRYEGFVVRESGSEVELRNIQGVSITLKLAELKKRGTMETSIMPVGLIDTLTAGEFASLLAFLESLKPK